MTKKQQCPKCDGTGIIDISHNIHWYYEDAEPEEHYDTCDFCDGTGDYEIFLAVRAQLTNDQ